jgi:WD40 repeat protein/Tol biopolymer transport system component
VEHDQNMASQQFDEKAIFNVARQIPSPEARAEYLRSACGGDSDLLQRVGTLLSAYEEQASFLELSPAREILGGPAPERLSEGLAAWEGAEATEDGSLSSVRLHDELGFLTPADKPGSLGGLGHYDVQEVVGCGGMGIVLKAFDQRLHRVVAIKVMAAQLATSATARKRFRREAQAAAAVSHDHVVTIHAVDEANGRPYIAMQYVAGASLEQRLQRGGPLELHEILRIGMQTAAGLVAAHAQGLIHRDIKPANILLENGVERVKITDFGLARAAADASLTQTGAVAGTPHYMAPEQARGDALDARTDLFSLGSVLYAMCTGRSPFRASSSMAVLRRVCEDTPTPIRETNPEIPDWLVGIIDKLHAKDPADRFQSAAEVAELLGGHLAHVQRPSGVRPVSLLPVNRKPASKLAPRRHRWAVAAALLLLCLLGGVSLTEATGLTHVRATAIRIFTPEGTLVVEVDDPRVKVTIEGDGGLVITGAGPQEVRLRPGGYKVRVTKDGNPVRKEELVTITRGDRQVVKVSMEGAILAKAIPQVPPLFPNEVRRFSGHTDGVQSVAISSDGQRVLSGGDDGTVRLWDLNSGKELRRFEGHSDKVYSVAFSPVDRRVVSGSLDMTVRLWDLETGKELRRFLGHTNCVACVAVLPNARRIISGGNDNVLRLWDVETGGELRTFKGHTRQIYSVAVSPDGRRALSGSWDNTMRLWDLENGKELHRFDGHSDVVKCVTFSPDGLRALSAGATDQTVRLWDVETGAELRRFEGHRNFAHSVAFSPDGQRAVSGGTRVVYLWDVSSGRLLQSFVGHTGEVACVAFAPDGRHAVSADWNGDSTLRLWQLPEASSEQASEPEAGAIEDDIRKLTERIEKSADDQRARIERAHLYVQQRRWRDGADDLRAAGEATVQEPGDAFLYAILLVHLREYDLHRRLCEQMLERFSATDDVWTANCLVKSCLLRPGAVDPARLPLALLSEDREFATEEPQWLLREARAFHAYRSGRWEEARRLVRETLSVPAYKNDPLYAPRALSILAMASSKSGDRRLALDLYQQARQQFDKIQLPAGHPGASSWLLTEIIRSEAAQELGLEEASAQGELQAFVVLAANGAEVRKFDTLAQAVSGASDGDTIEIRSNGPFETEPIEIRDQALVIRAGAGCRPVLQLSAKGTRDDRFTIRTNAPLVLEGLEFQRIGISPGLRSVIESRGAALHLANCQFVVKHNNAVCIWGSYSPTLEVRNCAFFGSRCAVESPSPKEGTLTVDNCVLTSYAGVSFHHSQQVERMRIQLTRNSFAGINAVVLDIFTVPEFSMPGTKGETKRFELQAESNVFDVAHSIFCPTQIAAVWKDTSIAPAEFTKLVSNMLGWRDRSNLYPPKTLFMATLKPGGPYEALFGPEHLKEWRQFAGPEAAAHCGKGAFTGGDVFAKAAAAPELLLPEHFTLLSESPGYRAGQDGKDLGPDIVLVGTGEAYERWKTTQEYQQWREETGQADFVRLENGKDLSERKSNFAPSESARGMSSDSLSADDWVWTTPVNLGAPINTEHGEFHPFLAADGLTLLFSSDRPGGQGQKDLWLSERSSIDAPWQPPVNLGKSINTSYLEGSSFLSPDGLTLFVNSDRPGGQGHWDIWMYRRESREAKWSDAINLGPPINSPWGEGAPCLTQNGLVLLFQTNRPGGEGGEDLWISHRTSLTSKWLEPVSLGASVNTEHEESGPSLSADGRTVFFGSNRTGVNGDLDLWMSRGASAFGPWSRPIHLGRPHNGGGNDKNPALSADGLTLIFESGRTGNLGGHDLWITTRIPKIDYVRRANEHAEQGRLDAAAVDYNTALDLIEDPNPYGAERLRIVDQFASSEEVFERVVELRPSDINQWSHRAHHLAKAGRWEESIACYQKRLELGPDGAGLWQAYSLALLARNDEAAYRTLCEKMLARFAAHADPGEAAHAALAMVVVPDSVKDKQLAFRLAERAANGDPNEVWWINLTYAAWLYRLDRLDDAIVWLNKGKDGDYQGFSLCFLAMAHHRLGHAEEARRYADAARHKKSAWNESTTWYTRVRVERLIVEMDSVLAAEPDEPQASQAEDAKD